MGPVSHNIAQTYARLVISTNTSEDLVSKVQLIFTLIGFTEDSKTIGTALDQSYETFALRLELVNAF